MHPSAAQRGAAPNFRLMDDRRQRADEPRRYELRRATHTHIAAPERAMERQGRRASRALGQGTTLRPAPAAPAYGIMIGLTMLHRAGAAPQLLLLLLLLLPACGPMSPESLSWPWHRIPPVTGAITRM